MDNLKDTSRKDSVTRYFDVKDIRTNPFGDNQAGVRAYLRAERVVAAVYLITRHIPEHEPARVQAREAALDVLSSILALRDEMRAPESPPSVKTRALIRKLMSLVRMLSVGGHISSANAELLVDVLDDLGAFLVSSQKTVLSESAVLTRDDFVDTQRLETSAPRDTHKGRLQKPIKDTARRRNVSSNRVHKVQRTEHILGILGANGQLGIKDIAGRLPEYSEKMIQRELKKLVALGSVKKSGSKRWSTYELAQ